MKLIERIRGNAFVSAAAKIGTGNIIAQGLSLVSAPILSRIYSTSAYGHQAIVVSTGVIIAAISAVGLTSAIMKPTEDGEANKVFSVAYLTQCVLSTVAVALIWILRDSIKVVSIDTDYAQTLICILLYAWVTNLSGMLLVLANRHGLYRLMMRNSIINAALNFVIAIPLGVIGVGWYGLAITTISSQLICASVFLIKLKPFCPIRHLKVKEFIGVFKKNRDYILFQWPANFITDYTYQMPTQSISRMYLPSDLGSYNMCERLLNYPVKLITRPISTVYFKTATTSISEGKDIANMSYKFLKYIVLLSFVPVLLLMFFGKPLVVFLLGDAWELTGTVISTMAPLAVYMMCATCFSYYRVAAEKQKSSLILSVVELVMMASTIGLCGYFDKGIVFTVAALTFAKCLFYTGDTIINFRYMKKHAGKVTFILIAFLLITTAVNVFRTI